MNRSPEMRRVTALLLVAGLAVLVWRSVRLSAPASPLQAVSSPAAGGAGGELAKRGGGRAPAQDGEGKVRAMTALVMERLREWEDEDEPDLRPARTQELETLLAGVDRMEIVAALPPGPMDFVFGLPSFQQWMTTEPRAAADWMRDHPGVAEARLLTLLMRWGARDPDAMEAYLIGLPEGAWRQKALAAASGIAMPVDPVEALGWAAGMSVDARRTGLLEQAMVGWAQRDPGAAAAWVAQEHDPWLRQRLAGALAVGYAQSDPALAAQWAIGSVQPGAVLDRTVAEIAGVWAVSDPAAVAEWVIRFPDGEGRRMVLGNLMNVWGNRDRAAAAAWARALGDAAMRRDANRVLAALAQ